MELNKGQFLVIIAVLAAFAFITSFEGSIITGSVIEVKAQYDQGEPCNNGGQCVPGLVCSYNVCTSVDRQVKFYTERIQENPLDRGLVPWTELHDLVRSGVNSFLGTSEFYQIASAKQDEGHTKNTLSIAARYDLNQDGCVDIVDREFIEFVVAHDEVSSLRYDFDKNGSVGFEDIPFVVNQMDKAAACPYFLGDFDNDRCIDNDDRALFKEHLGEVNVTDSRFDIDENGSIGGYDYTIFKAVYGDGDRCETSFMDELVGDFNGDLCVDDEDLLIFGYNRGNGMAKYDLDGDGFNDLVDEEILKGLYGGENCDFIIEINNDPSLSRNERYVRETVKFNSRAGNKLTLADAKVKLDIDVKSDVNLDVSARYLYVNPVSSEVGLNFVEIEPEEDINEDITEVVLTVDYDDADVTAFGLNEYLLTLYFYNGNSWDELPSVVNTTSNEVTATVNHLSVFGIFEKDNVVPVVSSPPSSGGSSGGGSSGGSSYNRGSSSGGLVVVDDEPEPEPEVVVPEIEPEVVPEEELAKGVLNLISKILLVVLFVAFGYLILKRVLKH